MANNVDPDQTAPLGAVWSGSALFAYVILPETLVFEFLGHLPYWHLLFYACSVFSSWDGKLCCRVWKPMWARVHYIWRVLCSCGWASDLLLHEVSMIHTSLLPVIARLHSAVRSMSDGRFRDGKFQSQLSHINFLEILEIISRRRVVVSYWQKYVHNILV